MILSDKHFKRIKMWGKKHQARQATWLRCSKRGCATQIQLTGDGIFQKIQVWPRAHNGTGKAPIPVEEELGSQLSGSRVRRCSNYPPTLESLDFFWFLLYSKEEAGKGPSCLLKSSSQQVSGVKHCNK